LTCKEKGVEINKKKLQEQLGVPVIHTIASRGAGLTRQIDKVIELKGAKSENRIPEYGKEIESCISKLAVCLKEFRALSGEMDCNKTFGKGSGNKRAYIRKLKPEVIKKSEQFSKELEEIHGHDSSIVIA
jgi:Fe2+ transport system protein B